MKLSELKEQIDRTVEVAEERYEVSADEIPVSLQLFIWDGKKCQKGNTYWANEDVEVHYDNNGLASGCVLTANRVTEKNINEDQT